MPERNFSEALFRISKIYSSSEVRDRQYQNMKPTLCGCDSAQYNLLITIHRRIGVATLWLCLRVLKHSLIRSAFVAGRIGRELYISIWEERISTSYNKSKKNHNHIVSLRKNTFFSSTGGGAEGFAAAGSSWGGNPSFLRLSAWKHGKSFDSAQRNSKLSKRG